MNEKRIQEVIEIEKQADDIYIQAVNEAARIPQQAEQEAKELVEKARHEAEKEAHAILASAEAKEECNRILAQVEETNARSQKLAKQNLNRAITYVISRVLGRE